MSALSTLRDALVIAALTVSTVTVGVTFGYHPAIEVGPSMEPTLRDGARLLMAKYPYGWNGESVPVVLQRLGIGAGWIERTKAAMPHRGDVIVFRRPGGAPGDHFTKRVIGLPGDRVALRRGVPVVNGVAAKQGCALTEASAAENEMRSVIACTEQLPARAGGSHYSVQRLAKGGVTREALGFEAAAGFLDNTREYQVPPGHVFVLGDNRDDSVDSRFPLGSDGTGVGFIPVENIVGRVDFTLAPVREGPGDSWWGGYLRSVH